MKAAVAQLAALAAGFGCMAAELTAVRLLAPHFGDSAYVWTNVIGVILAAVALGAMFGGRRAAGPAPAPFAGRLLLGAALWLALAPYLVGWLGPWLLPQDLPLDAAMPALVRGSLVATALVFAPPMLLLGAVSPLLITAVVHAGHDVGRAAGGLGAAGTVGSLLGTFLATHWLVPSFGCRVTMMLCGLVLALGGALLLGSAGRPLAPAVVGLLVLASGFGHGGPLREAPAGRTLLAEVESRSQFLQVVQDAPVDAPGAASGDVSGGAPARTLLVINEGLDSFHSMAVAGSVFTGGAYYDWHALAPLLAGDGRRPDGLRALSLGDAAGTLRRIYAAVHPAANVDAVDIDAATMALGRAHFPGATAPGHEYVLDGRVFLGQAQAQWHVIHVDAYAHQVYVPAHLASREFFAACKRRLRPGGVVACNVGALRDDDAVLRAIGTTMAGEFGSVLALPVPNSRNVLLVARLGGELAPERLRVEATADARLGEADRAAWQRLVEHAANRAFWRQVPAGDVLVDDRPSLDELLRASYVANDDDGALVACTGARGLEASELAAYAARQERDWLGVLAAVAASSRPSAYLRELAGAARWSLRQLRCAAAEYEAAAGLCADDAERARLREQARFVAEDLAPSLRAAATATRNGWLQWSVLVAAVLAAVLLCRSPAA